MRKLVETIRRETRERRQRSSAAGGRRYGRYGARPLHSSAAGGRRYGTVRSAFTVVELMVVIAIIALIISMGVPAFNAMNVQQRVSKARQLLKGAMTRTHIIAVSDKSLAAVRIMPADWYLDRTAASAGSPAARQIITTYSWKQTSSPDPDNPLEVKIEERFQAISDGPRNLLPPDTWVAPAEAFAIDGNRDQAYYDSGGGSDVLGNHVLQGDIGNFELDAGGGGERFLDADDFLIVFDPEIGVLRSKLGMNRRLWPLYAFDPRPREDFYTGETETAGLRNSNGGFVPNSRYQRHNFSGLVVYRREPFAALGAVDAGGTIRDRRDMLDRIGETYYVNRGGGLTAGAGEQVGEE